MQLVKYYLAPFFASLLFTLVLTHFIRRIALRKKIFDTPSKRKVHAKAIPTLGGIAIWLGFNLGMAVAFFTLPGLRFDFLIHFLGLSCASIIIVALGVYDDLHDCNAYIKLIIQIVAALILISFGFEISIISGPTGGGLPLGVLSVFITVLWIVGMINAINLLDGLDGLAAGVSGIAVLFLFIAALEMRNIAVACLGICFVGSVIGFLPFNFYPAKIFMGNTGSMFLGLIVSVIALAGFQKRTAVFTLFVPLLAVALPLIDTSLSIIRRLLKKRPVFKADKEHIHHKLFVVEKSQTRAVLSLYFLTFCFGLIALSFYKLTGIYAVAALIIVGLVTYRWLKSWGFLEFK